MKIAAAVLVRIETHARRTAPDECCGLLIGTPEAVTRAIPTLNRSSDPRRRYEIDPREHFACMREARAAGLDVVGAYHSHPRSAPVPSEIDRQQAFENFLFLIVGLADEAADYGAWRLEGGNFTAVLLVRIP